MTKFLALTFSLLMVTVSLAGCLGNDSDEEDFDEIVENFPNFSFHAAMSEPLPEDDWNGPTGFIHQVLLDNYLNEHDDPTEVEYYLCGPPPMIDACQKMLYELGVEPEMIAYDSFG